MTNEPIQIPQPDQYEELNVHMAAGHVAAELNKLPMMVRSCTYEVVDESFEEFREAALELESLAYAGDGIEDRVEDGGVFEHQYHEAESHGNIVYIAAWTKERELLGFVSIFQHMGPFLFKETADAYRQHAESTIDPLTPRFIVSKIVRNPAMNREISRANAPHRIMTASIVHTLSHMSPHGILVETQAQPGSQKMLRPEAVRPYFPGYQVLYPEDLYTPEGGYTLFHIPDERIPHVPMLMLYPHLPEQFRAMDMVKTALKSMRRKKR